MESNNEENCFDAIFSNPDPGASCIDVGSGLGGNAIQMAKQFGSV